MRIIFLLYALLISAYATAEDAIGCDIAGADSFEQKGTLLISRALSGRSELFTLCAGEGKNNYFLLLEWRPPRIQSIYSVDSGNKHFAPNMLRRNKNWGAVWSLWINKEDYKDLKELFSGLGRIPDDDISGLDGSDWCFKNQNKSRCVWTPTYNTEERKLESLAVVGFKLWELFDDILAAEELY